MKSVSLRRKQEVGSHHNTGENHREMNEGEYWRDRWHSKAIASGHVGSSSALNPSTRGKFLDRLNGFQVSATAHKFQHDFATFPRSDCALTAIRSFRSNTQTSFGDLRLSKGWNGQDPKPEVTKYALGLQLRQ